MLTLVEHWSNAGQCKCLNGQTECKVLFILYFQNLSCYPLMGEEVFMKVIKIMCNIIQFDLYSLKSTQWAVKRIQGCCFF